MSAQAAPPCPALEWLPVANHSQQASLAQGQTKSTTTLASMLRANGAKQHLLRPQQQPQQQQHEQQHEQQQQQQHQHLQQQQPLIPRPPQSSMRVLGFASIATSASLAAALGHSLFPSPTTTRSGPQQNERVLVVSPSPCSAVSEVLTQAAAVWAEESDSIADFKKHFARVDFVQCCSGSELVSFIDDFLSCRKSRSTASTRLVIDRVDLLEPPSIAKAVTNLASERHTSPLSATTRAKSAGSPLHAQPMNHFQNLLVTSAAQSVANLQGAALLRHHVVRGLNSGKFSGVATTAQAYKADLVSVTASSSASSASSLMSQQQQYSSLVHQSMIAVTDAFLVVPPSFIRGW